MDKADEVESDSTEDLPDRFDKYGRRIDHDREGGDEGGGIGMLLESLGLSGGSGGRARDGDREGRDGGRRRRGGSRRRDSR